jgi:hypothetical protein
MQPGGKGKTTTTRDEKDHLFLDFTAGGRGRRPDKGQVSIQLVKQVAQEMMRGAPPSPPAADRTHHLHAYHLQGKSLIAVFAALIACQAASSVASMLSWRGRALGHESGNT